MSYKEDTDDGPARRLIFKMRERAQLVRNQYLAERVEGHVTDETRRQLATVVLQYHDVLWEHRDEQVVKDAWEEAGIENIQELADEQVQVGVSTSGRASHGDPITRPAIVQLDHRKLYRASKALDKIAKDLGFAASVATQVADLDEAVV